MDVPHRASPGASAAPAASSLLCWKEYTKSPATSETSSPSK